MKKDNDNNSFGSLIFHFIAVIVAFNIFWPAGIFMLFTFLRRIGVFDKRTATSKNIGSDSKRAARMEKYKIMTEGRRAESIDYLASAVGVSYDTAIRDLQQMVIEGQFGASAYINYVDKTLVIIPEERAKSTAAKTESKSAKSGASAEAPGKKPGKAAENAKKDTDSGKKDKKPDAGVYDGLRLILLIAGILLLGAGIWRLVKPVDWLIWLGVDSYTLTELIPGALMAGGGVFSLLYRGVLKKRSTRFKVYEAACTGKDYVPLSELASKAGVSARKARKDIETMIDKGLLGKSAYIDHGDGMLILKPGASPKVEDEPEPPKDDEDRYRAILREIRDLNDAIPDPDVSRRIDEMEALTSKIFQAVQEKPEKLPQIKSFMSYYLPTTLKLLRSYADFEGTGADGENVRTAKAEIERILDTLVDGFKKQLDKLYEADALDISSDIDVLETMLRRDGLAGDGSSFKAATNGK
ncbi:MAG: 5-bromo-4-chloroindolyl phosphate hydrolysis family protein [Oscillospiraceae bacterium]